MMRQSQRTRLGKRSRTEGLYEADQEAEVDQEGVEDSEVDVEGEAEEDSKLPAWKWMDEMGCLPVRSRYTSECGHGNMAGLLSGALDLLLL